MPSTEDPRIYFAAERTLLAWIRTGITIIGLGFVVAKFWLFLHYLVPHEGTPIAKPGFSMFFGIAMVLFGSTTCLGAAWQFRRFIRTLTGSDLPRGWSPLFPLWITYTLALGGLLLIGFLLI